MRFYPLLPAPIAAFCLVIAISPAATAKIQVELGSAEVDLSAGGGVAMASLDIAFSNSTSTAMPIAGYTLFLDIGTSGAGLPQGVSFAVPAVTYVAGLGTPPLPSAGPGTMNLSPAAGDIGLGQLQFSNAMINPGEIFPILTVNLEIDRAQAIAGVYDISLNPLGENSLNAIAGTQPFSVTDGLLTLAALPGDFDLDMDVDGFDFLLWQRGLSPVPLNATDLVMWENNFGLNSSPLTSTVRAVPEPGAWLLFALGILCVYSDRNPVCR